MTSSSPHLGVITRRCRLLDPVTYPTNIASSHLEDHLPYSTAQVQERRSLLERHVLDQLIYHFERGLAVNLRVVRGQGEIHDVVLWWQGS